MSSIVLGSSGAGGATAVGQMGARAALVAATPELLARVDALPPLRGDPTIDLAEATADDGNTTLRRLVRRFRWPMLLIAALVLVDAGTSLVGPLLIRHGIDAGVSVDNGRVVAAVCVAYLVVQLRQLGQPDRRAAATPRTRPSGCCTRCAPARSPTSNACRSTTTTRRWAGGS